MNFNISASDVIVVLIVVGVILVLVWTPFLKKDSPPEPQSQAKGNQQETVEGVPEPAPGGTYARNNAGRYNFNTKACDTSEPYGPGISWCYENGTCS